MPQPIRTLEEFYAHALAVEHEAFERYAELEAHFADAGEDVLAGLCGQLAEMEHEHFRRLIEACRHLTLPAIGARDHRWLGAATPGPPARAAMIRVAHPRQLLELALGGEVAALAFFQWVAATCGDAQARQLAESMAAEERAHVQWVHHALEYHATTEHGGADAAPVRRNRAAAPSA